MLCMFCNQFTLLALCNFAIFPCHFAGEKCIFAKYKWDRFYLSLIKFKWNKSFTSSHYIFFYIFFTTHLQLSSSFIWWFTMVTGCSFVSLVITLTSFTAFFFGDEFAHWFINKITSSSWIFIWSEILND